VSIQALNSNPAWLESRLGNKDRHAGLSDGALADD
jgi:hypothetical protein